MPCRWRPDRLGEGRYDGSRAFANGCHAPEIFARSRNSFALLDPDRAQHAARDGGCENTIMTVSCALSSSDIKVKRRRQASSGWRINERSEERRVGKEWRSG